MRLALDLFLIFGSFCLVYSSIRGFDYGRANRFSRAMHFVPANIVMRIVMVIVACRVLGDALNRHGWPQLRSVIGTAPFQLSAGVVTVAMLVLVGYAVFSKRIQSAQQA